MGIRGVTVAFLVLLCGRAHGEGWTTCPLRAHASGDKAEFELHVDGGVARNTAAKQKHVLHAFTGQDRRLWGHTIYIVTPDIACAARIGADTFIDLEQIPHQDAWHLAMFIAQDDAPTLGWITPPDLVDPDALEDRTRTDYEQLMRARIKHLVLEQLGRYEEEKRKRTKDRDAPPAPQDFLKLPASDEDFEAAHADLRPWITERSAQWKVGAAPDAVRREDAIGRREDAIGREVYAIEKLQRELTSLVTELVAHPANAKAALDAFWPGESLAHTEKSSETCVDDAVRNVPITDLAVWPVGLFDLPATGSERTLELRTGGAPSTLKLEERAGIVTVWATYVSRDQRALTFEWVRGAKTGPSLAEVIGTFVGALGPIAVGKAGGPSTSLVGLLSDDPQCPWSLRIEAGTALAYEPLAPLHSITGSVDENADLDHGRSYTVSACTSGACRTTDAAAKTSTVIATGTVTTSPNWGFTLFGGLEYSFRPSGRHRPFFTSYQFEPSTANNAGMQLYRLDEVRQPLQGIAAALHLALVSPSRRFGIGGGPDITLADGSGKFSQWTANVFFGPKCLVQSGLYLTVGGGFRLFNAPIVGKFGDIVEASAPPTLVQQAHAEAVITVGLALDLYVVGSAAATLFGAKVPSQAKD
jgi:hypothetical protein